MSTLENNKALVKDFFEKFSKGETEQAFQLVDEKVDWWVPGTLPFSGHKTKQQYLSVVGSIRSGFPDGFVLKVTAMIAEGDDVAAEVSSDGKHANGKTYNNFYHFLIRIKDGKFISVKEYMDTLHLYQLIQK